MYKNKTNYIFDLYGTLIDIHTDEHSARNWKKWCKYLDNKGISHPAYYRFRDDFFAMDRRNRRLELDKGIYSFVEIDIIDVYRELFFIYGNGIINDLTLNEIAYAFRTATRSYIRLFPGVREYLIKLKERGFNAYILSNAQRAYTMPEIKMFNLDSLTHAQFISSDYGCMKPDKKYFDSLIEGYKLERDTVLMHGDSYESDVIGAKNAGIDCVYLSGDNKPQEYYINELQTC